MNETILLSPQMTNKFPKLSVSVENNRIVPICSVDHNECLNPIDPAEDFAISNDKIVRFFTAYCQSGCILCSRNLEKD